MPGYNRSVPGYTRSVPGYNRSVPGYNSCLLPEGIIESVLSHTYIGQIMLKSIIGLCLDYNRSVPGYNLGLCHGYNPRSSPGPGYSPRSVPQGLIPAPQVCAT